MVGDNIGDSVPGVWTALGIMMALETRRKTGRGQHVDMAMYDCMVAHTTSSMPLYQATGQTTGRARENMFSAQLVLKAKDGYAVLAGAGDEEKWVALWELIGRPELGEDPRYRGLGISGEFYFEHIVPAIEEWSQELPKLEVAERLIEIGYSMGMVQNTEDLDDCPQLEARNMFVDSGDTYGGPFRTVNTPIKLTGSVDTPVAPPPLLGEHNEDILCSIGGLSPAELGRMQSEGVV
jgi:formyl-CoA transferase